MEFLKTLYQAKAGAQRGLDAANRINYPYIAVVTNNVDPLNRRRIKVADPTSPAIETDWLRRIQPWPSYDPPLPLTGSTVIVLHIDGQPSNGWYMQCVNDTNPPHPKLSPVDDLHATVPGEQSERTGGDRVLNVGASLTLQTDGGASIVLGADGSVVLTSSAGQKITLAGAINVDAASFTVGGKEIATIDALDTSNDTLTTRGW